MSDDYYSAMSRIEKQLDLVDIHHVKSENAISRSERDQLLLFIDQLAENQGQDSVAQTLEEMCFLLDSSQTDLSSTLTTNEDLGLGQNRYLHLKSLGQHKTRIFCY